MINDFFTQDGTETITITGNGREPQIIEGVKIKASKNLVKIYEDKLPDNDINSVQIEVGDIIEHTNKARATEKYEVESVDYEDNKKMNSSFPNQIKIKVSNVKLKEEDASNIINITGVESSNISINSPNSSQSIQEIIKKAENNPEIQEKLKELEEAIKKKDKNKLQYVLGFLLDKGFDFGVGVLLAKLIGKI
jgi:hypothetical protein